jgi:hypothetical protein
MVSDRRLLILSCSQRKRSDPGLLPAIERYDGPAFRVLRRFLREQPGVAGLDVFVLSAAYGLIPAEYPIAEYDQVMTPQRAAELHDEMLAIFSKLIRTGHTVLCLTLSVKYLIALEGWSALVPPGVSVTVANGSQGVKLTQLKRWLWGETVKEPGRKPKKIEPRGIARLRGIELRLTSAQVFEQARAALAEDGTGVNCFRKWYVEVDGQRVAPKWMVRVLTGLPVSAFTTGEARRVLCQLGLHVRQITEMPNDNQGA